MRADVDVMDASSGGGGSGSSGDGGKGQLSLLGRVGEGQEQLMSFGAQQDHRQTGASERSASSVGGMRSKNDGVGVSRAAGGTIDNSLFSATISLSVCLSVCVSVLAVPVCRSV